MPEDLTGYRRWLWTSCLKYSPLGWLRLRGPQIATTTALGRWVGGLFAGVRDAWRKFTALQGDNSGGAARRNFALGHRRRSKVNCPSALEKRSMILYNVLGKSVKLWSGTTVTPLDEGMNASTAQAARDTNCSTVCCSPRPLPVHGPSTPNTLLNACLTHYVAWDLAHRL
ncbi:hypothetical protein OG21DRAFT_1510124, partial [Imleria badia]